MTEGNELQNHCGIVQNMPAKTVERAKRIAIIRLTAGFCLLDIGYALSQTMLGPMVPEIQKIYGVSLAENGLLTFFQGAGGIAALLLSIFIADMFNKKTFMAVAYTIYNIMLFLAALLPAYWLLVIIFFVIGAGTRLFDALVNANMSEVHNEKKGFFLNLLHACFGIGALLGPVLASMVLVLYGLVAALFLIACLCAVLLGAYLLLNGKEHKRTPRQSAMANAGQGYRLATLLKNRTIVLLSLCTMTYVGFATGVSMWLPSYLMDELNAGPIYAASVVSLLWAGIIAGRCVYSVFSLKFSTRNLLFVSNLAGGIILVTASLINTGLSLMIGYVLSGFLIGAVVPLSVALANKVFANCSGRITSIIMLFASLGLTVIPAMIGVIAGRGSFRIAVLVLNLCPALVAVLAFFITPQK